MGGEQSSEQRRLSADAKTAPKKAAQDEKNTTEQLKVGDTVRTSYGVGTLDSIRKDGICCITLTSWSLSEGAPVRVYVTPEYATKICENTMQVGDTVKTSYGIGRLEQIRQDGLFCITLTSWSLSQGAPVRVYVLPACATKMHKKNALLGKHVITPQGEGAVTGFRVKDSMFEVTLTKWMLSEGTCVKTYLQEGAFEVLNGPTFSTPPKSSSEKQAEGNRSNDGAPLKDWVPKSETGWMWSHEAIRADVRDTREALDSMINTKVLEASWMNKHLFKWTRRFIENVLQHHMHEETVHFPFFKKEAKFEIPPSMEKGHNDLVKLTEDFEAAIDAYKKASDKKATREEVNALLEKAKVALNALDTCMEAHLKEEEDTVLELMMANFTQREMQKVELKMIKSFKWVELPHFYRRVTRAEAKQHATKSLGIPGPVFTLFIGPLFTKYEGKYGRPLRELIDPTLHQKRKGKSVEIQAAKA